MELLTPDTTIVVFQLAIAASWILFAIAWILILTHRAADATTKIVWLLGTLFLPIMGPVIYFVQRLSGKASGNKAI